MIENGSEILPAHQPKERIYTLSFQELALQAGAELSFQHASAMLNRLLHRQEMTQVKTRTYQDFCHREGQKLAAYMDKSTEMVLEHAGFDIQTGKPDTETATEKWKETGTIMAERETIQQAIQTINALRPTADEQVKSDYIQMENPADTCYVSIDGIGVKHQKEHRRNCAQKQGAYVWNTVAAVQSQEYSYTVTGVGMPQVFRNLLACLLSNRLLEQKTLVFFTDGASDIRRNIEETFAFRPYQIILDWYHLKKRCQEYLSMSVKGGKENRNLVLQKLLRILWVGNVEQAVSYLEQLDKTQLRPQNRIADLCGYFLKHRNHIPCYALRHHFGLRNSSNRVEKANDLVVAQRQKHNGMSWSCTGSAALAQIKALFVNNDAQNWLLHHRLSAFPTVAA